MDTVRSVFDCVEFSCSFYGETTIRYYVHIDVVALGKEEGKEREG